MGIIRAQQNSFIESLYEEEFHYGYWQMNDLDLRYKNPHTQESVMDLVFKHRNLPLLMLLTQRAVLAIQTLNEVCCP